MRIVKKIFLLTVLFFISCKKEEIKSLVFNKKFRIEGEKILEEYVNINSINIIDSLLLCNIYGGKYHFSVFNSKTLEHLGEIVKKGNGPSELPTYAIYNHFYGKNDALKIWVHDLNSQLLCQVNILESLKKGVTIIDKKIQIKAIPNFFQVFYIDSTKLVGRSTNTTPKMNRLQIYDTNKDSVIKYIPPFPEVKNRLDFDFKRYNNLFVSTLRMKPDKTKFISAMHAFNRIDIFDLKGNVEKSILEGSEVDDKKTATEYLTIKDLSKSSLKDYYSDAFTSEKYIYASYRGQLDSDYGIKLIPTKIRVFSWSGTPLVEITVPDYLFSFTIDEKNGYMYGVDYHNENILRYNIKHILN